MAETDSTNSAPRVALIGFGEAGESFARAGNWSGYARGWDLLEGRRVLMAECGVEPAGDAAGALADAGCVLSLVTADAALQAARDYARHLPQGALWLDMNSVAPATKRAAAEAVEAAGGAYVDVAVMAPVDKRLAVPLLLAGPEAATARGLLERLGFTDIRMVGADVGRASAIKLCRSIMVKGLEALSAECAAAAEKAGVLEEVTASLDASEKALGWSERMAYNRERMETHGLRRAAEMEEACAMIETLGVEPVMSRGTVRLQRAAARPASSEGEQ